MKGLTLHINFNTLATKRNPKSEVRFVLTELLRSIGKPDSRDPEWKIPTTCTDTPLILWDSRGEMVGKVQDDSVGDNLLFLVVQQGGATAEWYASVYGRVEKANEAIRGHAKASYNAIGPFTIPAGLPDRLLSALCDVIDKVCTAVATEDFSTGQ